MCVHRESGAQRAVKVLRKSHMDEDEKRMLFNEINILKEIVREMAFNSLNQRHSEVWLLLMPAFRKFNLFEFIMCLVTIASNKPRCYCFHVCRITPISSRCTSSSRTRSATTLSLSKYPPFELRPSTCCCVRQI